VTQIGSLSHIAGDGPTEGKEHSDLFRVTDAKFERHEVCTFMRVNFFGFVIFCFN